MTDPLISHSAPPPLARGDEKTMPIVVYVLYLLGYVSGGLTTLIGVIMAYVLKGDAGPMARSHYDFQIRTFWLALLGLLAAVVIGTVGVVLLIVLIGFPILLLAKLVGLVVAIWYGVRSVVGLLGALKAEVYPTPRSYLL